MFLFPRATGAFLLLSSVATAQTAPPTELAPVIFTGGLTPIEAQRYGRSVTVLTGQEIEDRGILTVQDALRAVPGVSVNGSGSSFTQVRIRGGEGNQTLILIDGIEAAGGDGEYILSGLDTANIERIEVLRGPQSVIFGANASAGVVNIITRRGSREGTELRFSAETGNGYSATGFGAVRGARGGLSFSYSDARDDGWDFSGDDGEKDGTFRRSGILSGDWSPVEDLLLGFTWRRSQETYDFDSTNYLATTADDYVVDDPDQRSARFEETAGIYAQYEMFAGRIRHRLDLQATDNRQGTNGGDPTKTSKDATKYRLSFGLDGTVDTAGHLASLLLEREEDSSSSNPDYDRKTESIAAEYRASLAFGLDLQFGLRHDDNDSFRDTDTWTVGASYPVPGTPLRLRASAGTGSVKPSYSELFADEDYGYAVYTGNPDLKAEENQSWDVGVELDLSGRGTLDVTYFEETLTNEIVSYAVDPGAFPTVYTYRNSDEDSDRRGVELAGRYQATDALALRLDYTWLDAENADGSVEIRRPGNELGLGATLAVLDGRGLVSADLRHVWDNADTQFWTYDYTTGGYTTKDLPVVTTVDLAAQYAVTDTVRLTARVVNLFDDDNVDVWGYAGRPRSFYAGLQASF